MPSGDQLIKAVEYTDCAIKFEILLTSFHAMMKFSSFLEIGTVIIMAGFFIRSPDKMWFYMFHVWHLGRGMTGILMCTKIPYPQNFIESLRKEADKDQRQ
jgi:hypothetical protein